MRWNYTKTLLILVAAAVAVRYAVAVALNADPWSTHSPGGGLFGAIALLIMALPIFVLMDLGARYRQRRAAGNRVASAIPMPWSSHPK